MELVPTLFFIKKSEGIEEAQEFPSMLDGTVEEYVAFVNYFGGFDKKIVRVRFFFALALFSYISRVKIELSRY